MKPIRIISYQLIIEKDVEPHRHMIGTFGLSMYLPPSVTRIDLPDGFLQRRTAYNWEVLAIERSEEQRAADAAALAGALVLLTEGDEELAHTEAMEYAVMPLMEPN